MSCFKVGLATHPVVQCIGDWIEEEAVDGEVASRGVFGGATKDVVLANQEIAVGFGLLGGGLGPERGRFDDVPAVDDVYELEASPDDAAVAGKRPLDLLGSGLRRDVEVLRVTV